VSEAEPGAYLLIHGGATTCRFWDRLVPLLDGPALAIDLPGRGAHPADLMEVTVDDGVASIVADVDAADLCDGGRRALVVVAHSSGGLYVPGVLAALQDRLTVRRVVLAAASVPPEGGCGLDCMKASHRERFVAYFQDAKRDGRSVATPGPPDDAESLRDAYGGSLDDEALTFMADPVRNVADSFNIYFQPVRWSTVRSVPITYVRGALDRPVPAALQDEMIDRLPAADVVRLGTGHIPAVTDPERFAGIVLGRPA
jgi:pimeloyl-ACP methyl ester carboxylesterase